MHLADYISKDFPAFEADTLCGEAETAARDFGYTHAFVVRGGYFVGAVSRACLEDYPHLRLEELEPHFERFAIREDGNIIDSLKLFHIFNANVVAVLGAGEEYRGYLSCDDVFQEFSRYPIFSENGALLTVQTPLLQYSFTEVAKIVETNGAKLYGCFISAIHEDHVHITLKINGENLSSIDETFERYGYHVVDKYYSDQKEELLKDRYDFFQKYLEI